MLPVMVNKDEYINYKRCPPSSIMSLYDFVKSKIRDLQRFLYI